MAIAARHHLSALTFPQTVEAVAIIQPRQAAQVERAALAVRLILTAVQVVQVSQRPTQPLVEEVLAGLIGARVEMAETLELLPQGAEVVLLVEMALMRLLQLRGSQERLEKRRLLRADHTQRQLTLRCKEPRLTHHSKALCRLV